MSESFGGSDILFDKFFSFDKKFSFFVLTYAKFS